MSVFRKVSEFFQEPNPSEKLCSALRSYGYDAQLKSTGKTNYVPGNKSRFIKRLPFYGGWSQRGEPLGLIEIPKGLIRLIYVLRYQAMDNDPIDYVYLLIIPDERIRGTHPIQLKTVVHKNAPLIGMVTSIKWVDKERTSCVTDKLNDLTSVNQLIIQSINNGTGSDIEIDTGSSDGWLLSVREIPSPNLWEAYQTIAHELIMSPLL